MNSLLIASLALAGLVIGWGQRAVIVRYAVPAGEPARPHCPVCGHHGRPGRWVLWPLPTPAGRCLACGGRTGPLPLVVEAATALLLGALAARIHPGLVLAAACWLAICAVPLAFIDVAVHRLPDALTAPAYAGTAVFLLLAAATSGQWHNLARAAFGGLALAGFYLALVVINRSGLGMGDAKASTAVGTLLAWLSWGTLLTGVFAGFVLGGLYGVAVLTLRSAPRNQHLPFGPFLFLGAVVAIAI